jgi:hypothetical protein
MNYGLWIMNYELCGAEQIEVLVTATIDAPDDTDFHSPHNRMAK